MVAAGLMTSEETMFFFIDTVLSQLQLMDD